MENDELIGRVRVLETINERLEKDITELFRMLREHMDKEEQDRANDRKEREREMQEIRALISSVIQAQNGQKSFIGGIVLGVSSLWGAGITIYEVLKP